MAERKSTWKPFEKHGLTGTKKRAVWASMVGRCIYPSHSKWSYYGGRGIKCCVRWRNSVVAFYEDMGPCPTGYTIDRIDNNAHYSCGHCEECLENGWTANCRWESQKRQCRNKRNNVTLTWNGKTQSAPDWADETGLPCRLIVQRYRKLGWSAEKTLTTPAGKCERKVESEYEFRGKSQSIAAWARERQMDYKSLRARMYNGWTIEMALTTPVSRIRTFEIDGELLNLRDIERRNGLGRGTVSRRVRAGMSVTEALEAALTCKGTP
jgi:hypothetical protein